MDLSSVEKDVLLRAFRFVCADDSSVFIDIDDIKHELELVRCLLDKIVLPKIRIILERYRRMLEGYAVVSTCLEVYENISLKDYT